MIRYSENHHLRADEGGVSAHVALHLQGADLPTARRFVLRVLVVAASVARQPDSLAPSGAIIWPQTSGPCVHYDPDGVFSPDGDGENSEHQDEAPACAYPPERGGLCPHLDIPKVLCPVKESLCALRGVARLRSACEAEQEEQDMAMAAEAEQCDQVPRSDYVLAPPEPPATAKEPDVAPVQTEARGTPRGRRWTSEEEAVLRTAASAVSARVAYQEAFPDSGRTPAAVSSRWYRVRQRVPAPTPDFAGDKAPAPQCEEIDPDESDPERTVGGEAASQGIYGGDRRAYEADLMDGMMCDQPLSREPTVAPQADKPHPWLGMRVRVLDPLDLADRTGAVVQYNLDPREMLVALDGSQDRVWLPPESLLLIGAGRVQA